MLLIPCPHCGTRPSAEFSYHGEGPNRPSGDSATPQAWRSYLYEKDNVAGTVTEQWFHSGGCRRFLVVTRDTISNEIGSVRDRSGA